jgi:hypothetical protein
MPKGKKGYNRKRARREYGFLRTGGLSELSGHPIIRAQGVTFSVTNSALSYGIEGMSYEYVFY